MIILNQKKDIIINFSNVVSIYVQDKNVQVLMTFIEDALILGKYATEERAKEVLQEIIKHYNSLKRKRVYAMGDSGFTFEEKFYYEMPEK